MMIMDSIRQTSWKKDGIKSESLDSILLGIAGRGCSMITDVCNTCFLLIAFDCNIAWLGVVMDMKYLSIIVPA
jgi:hypothetical protein